MERPAIGHSVAHLPVADTQREWLTRCAPAAVFAFVPQTAAASPLGMDSAGGTRLPSGRRNRYFLLHRVLRPRPLRRSLPALAGCIPATGCHDHFSGSHADPGGELFQAPGCERKAPHTAGGRWFAFILRRFNCSGCVVPVSKDALAFHSGFLTAGVWAGAG